MRKLLAIGGLLGAFAGAAGVAHAGTPEMPWNAPYIHVGVATCAGSNCHGSQRPFDDAVVLQNEYFTWQRKDAHSNAYNVLLTPASERIAANLGISKAHEARECLVCHTDYVPAEKRGRRFSLSEGVGCEACHGGAEKWLGPHVTGNTHRENIADGLFPLADPVHRARLCLNCHLGSDDKPIDHRIMGAGHPPLEFELDTFTNIQPAHFRVNQSYRERKDYSPGAKTWAIGQLVAAEMFLGGLRSARFRDHGMFPELVFFDCTACHHPMRPPRWSPGAGGPLGPGEVRLADAHLVMSGHVIAHLVPELREDWVAALDGLHRASQRSVSQVQRHAGELATLIDRALSQLRDMNVGEQQALTLMDAVARSGIERDAADFTTAKQIFYALEAMLTFLKQRGTGGLDALDSPMDRVFKAVDAQADYAPDELRAGLRTVRSALAPLRSR